jgi:hypothetical protein
MDVLWAALAICAMVSVTFYVLAVSWQRTLRGHSRALRALFERLDALETVEDPVIRRKIGELMPSPLREVHILSFRLGERFWRNVLGATEQQILDIRENGTFVGSVKIEIWRSHVAVTVRELLPRSKSAGWHTRTLDIYAVDSGTPTVLWELCLQLPANSHAVELEQSSVELRYENGAIVLASQAFAKEQWLQSTDGARAKERIVFRVPLDAEQLAEFRISEADMEPADVEDGAGAARFGSGRQTIAAAVASFSYQDEQQGVDWQLRVRELDGRTAPGQWTIMEPSQVRRVS